MPFPDLRIGDQRCRANEVSESGGFGEADGNGIPLASALRPGTGDAGGDRLLNGWPPGRRGA